MKKIILFLLMFSFSLVNASAYATRAPKEEIKSLKGANDVYYEDFTSYEEGGLPENMSISQTENNRVEIVAAKTPDAESKNVLKITDASSTEAAVITLPVPESENPITLEMRIKYKQTTSPDYGFIMDFRDPAGTNAFRLIRFNSPNAPFTYVSYTGNDKNLTSSNNNNVNHSDSWFTIKVRIDSQLKQTGVIVENEQIVSEDTLNSAKYSNIYPDPKNKRVMGYKLPWVSDQVEKVTQVVLWPYPGSYGEHYIDYIKFTEDVPEFVPVRDRAESKETEIISDPSPALYPDIINLVFKDEIKYCVNPIVIRSGRAMAEASLFAEWYGMEFAKTDGEYEIKGSSETLTFRENNNVFEFNHNSLTADISPMIINGCVYIPVKSFSNALGSEVTWSENPRCVTIK